MLVKIDFPKTPKPQRNEKFEFIFKRYKFKFKNIKIKYVQDNILERFPFHSLLHWVSQSLQAKFLKYRADSNDLIQLV